MADYSNPLINYNFPALENKELRFFSCEEDRQPRSFKVMGKENPPNNWILKGWSVKYRFSQVIRSVFTNTDSYSDRERTPPADLTAATAAAAAVSMVALPDAIGAAASSPDYPDFTTAAIPDWELVKHELVLKEPGTYEVYFTLQTWTEEQWDWGAFTKTKIKPASELADVPEEP